jgi:hypothetical protein
MRPVPARVLFCLVAGIALTVGAMTGETVLFVVAAGALVVLATSLATSRVPLTRSLAGFRGQTVDVLLWGAPPPQASPGLVLTSVNIISFGVHVFFKASSGTLLHLKVAQPKRSIVTPDRVVIGTARYVQWNVAKVKPVAGTSAVCISRSRTASEVPESPISEASAAECQSAGHRSQRTGTVLSPVRVGPLGTVMACSEVLS